MNSKRIYICINEKINKEKVLGREMNEKINILIAEDHLMTGKLLRNMISDNDKMNVVEVVSNGADVLSQCSLNDIDVILLDLEMPDKDGFQIMDELYAQKNKTKALVYSAHTDKLIIEKSLQKGAAGYVTKKVNMEEILEAITTVHKGDNYLCDTCLHTIVNNYSAIL